MARSAMFVLFWLRSVGNVPYLSVCFSDRIATRDNSTIFLKKLVGSMLKNCLCCRSCHWGLTDGFVWHSHFFHQSIKRRPSPGFCKGQSGYQSFVRSCPNKTRGPSKTSDTTELFCLVCILKLETANITRLDRRVQWSISTVIFSGKRDADSTRPKRQSTKTTLLGRSRIKTCFIYI